MQDNLGEISSTFSSDLIQLNELADQGFTSWLIEPGMGFNDLHKWWGNLGLRPSHHEGTDIRLFLDQNGQIQTLSAGTMVPVILPGQIIKVLADFIAKTVIVSHEQIDNTGRTLHTFYAHIDPDRNMSTGRILAPGEVIGRLALPKGTSKCPAHLHISAAWIDGGTQTDDLVWQKFSTKKNIAFFDPLDLISP